MAETTENDVPKRCREIFERGMIALERDNLFYAIENFSAALDLEPRFLKARKFLRAAEARQAQEAPAGAAARILALVAGAPDIIKAHLAIRSGKPLQAMQLAEKLLRANPLNLRLLKLLGLAAEAAGLLEIAIQTLVFAREFHAADPELLVKLGNLYTAANQSQAARECFEALVDLRPNDGLALKAYKDAMARDSMIKSGWAEASKEGGDYRDMIKDIKTASILEEESKMVRAEHSVEKLIQQAAEKIMREPENINHRRALANLYVESNRFEEAMRVLEESRRVPGIDDSQLDHALAAIKIKLFDSDIAELRKNGDLAGAAAKQTEKETFRLQDIQARAERYPNDLPLRLEYGILLLEHGQLNEAIQHLQVAQRYPRNRIPAQFHLGLCFRKKKQLDMARDQLEQAAADLPIMNDLKKDIFYELGAVLEEMGQAREAVERYFKPIYQADISYKDVAAKIETAYSRPTAQAGG